MGRVFYNTRKRVVNLDAAYTILPSDSGSTFALNLTGGYAISLPNASDAQEGFHCEFIVKTAASATVTVSATDDDGDNMYLQAHSLDGTDRQVAGADVLSIVSAEKGDLITLFCDGTSWYVNAWVADDGHAALA